MKKIFTIAILLFSFQSFSQVTIKQVQEEIKKAFDASIYDTVLVRESKGGNVDTLVAPLNKRRLYEVSVEGEAGALLYIEVFNNNGKYEKRFSSVLTWSGKTGTKINSTVIGNRVIISITGTGIYNYQRRRIQ